MSNYLVLFIAYVVEGLISYYYFNENYSAKRNAGLTLLIGQLLYLGAFSLNIPFKVNPYLNIVSFFIITFLYAYLCFDISLKSCIFHSSIVTVAMIGT